MIRAIKQKEYNREIEDVEAFGGTRASKLKVDIQTTPSKMEGVVKSQGKI